ncbi:MAG TPA: 1-acyl-sn-glycerol-3-phosphate acyltransferase [Gemmatimonadaceae bacterium]|nr:1-acyl-sn-glycerol-3-phosphate acyltransferase [Gemmatimonadaceae bacterium]
MPHQEARRRGGMLASVNVPIIPADVARRSGWFMRTMGALVLRAFGWRFTGESFPDRRKFVLIIAPHTSNWDFAVGLAAMYALGMQGTFLAKHSLFKFPLGIVMRWLGGIPVNRKSSQDVVWQISDIIAKADKIIPVLTPEGTRSRAEKWRTGFYWIAKRSGVPIQPVTFDYSTKSVHFFPLFTPTTDSQGDIALLKAHFKPEMAKFPEQFST